MAIEFGYKVYVTKGELATIMGPLAYGSAKRQLRTGTSALGETGLDIIEILDENTGIWLDNPEVIALFDALAGYGIITAEVRQKVTAFVVNYSLVTPDGQPTTSYTYSNQYRVLIPEGIDNPIEWISDYLSADNSVSREGAYLIVDTDGTCVAPNTEVI